MGGKQDLDLLMNLTLLVNWLGSAGREHFHEERLMLWMQMRFRLLNQQERHLIRMRLQKQQFGGHE